MAAHLSITQHLLFHLLKMRGAGGGWAGEKKLLELTVEELKAGGGGGVRCAQRPRHSLFFFETMLLEVQLVNCEEGETDVFACDLNCTGPLSEPKCNFSVKDSGEREKEKMTISVVPWCIPSL